MLVTPDDSKIPRKVVVREDSTPLFRSADLNDVAGFARQWQIYFLVREKPGFLEVSPRLDVNPDSTFFIKPDTGFEWNTYFCLSYANAPAAVGRSQVVTFRTPEQARAGTGDTVLIEKPFHTIHWYKPRPILRQVGRDVYEVMSLYDDVDSVGNYVFKGNYTSGFVRHQNNAHVLLRYVSREQLDDNIKVLLGSQMRQKGGMSPTEMDDFWGPLRSLLADFGRDSRAGVNDMLAVFREEYAPSAVQHGIFDPGNLADASNSALGQELYRVTQRMISHFEDASAWNEQGFSFVPAEWLK